MTKLQNFAESHMIFWGLIFGFIFCLVCLFGFFVSFCMKSGVTSK